jgi:hypothetical protein
MPRKSFHAIAEGLDKDSIWKELYSNLAEHEKCSADIVEDSYVDLMGFTTTEIDNYRDLQYSVVKDNLRREGCYNSLADAEKKMTSVMPDVAKVMGDRSKSMQFILDAIKSGKNPNSKEVQDGYYNALTGIGVTGFDPGTFGMAYTPVSMSPNECTSYYASGGIASIIIDKKCQGALLNGYNFASISDEKGLSEEDRRTLKEYANSVGFDQQLEHTDRDGLIYGGAFCYPVFKSDRPDTFDMPIEQLVSEHIIDKDCIDYFVEGDRWNAITVPNWNITAKDYLSPDTYMIPLAGVRVNHERMAIVRPIMLPYWGALRQLGWGRSDYESYIKSLIAYKVLIAAVPIIGQQLSLLVHTIPLDGIIAQNGPGYAAQFAQNNNALLRAWSMTNPLTINSYGELKSIDRDFNGFADLNMALRQDIAANCGIPESVLFHTQATGFSDNGQDSTLKQSETIRNINNAVIPSYRNVVKLLVASCFGINSEQFKKSDTLRISFDSPDVISSEERSKMLEKFSSGVNLLHTAGINTKDSVVIALKFMPEIELSQELLNGMETENPEPNQANETNGNGANPAKPGYKPSKDAKTSISKEGKE